MELGNMIFGNSRGEAEIPRTPAWEGPWQELCKTMEINWRGWPEDACRLPQVDGVIDTPVFRVMSYDWNADCDCGADGKDEEEHTDACRLVQPNFLYKPTGFRINWYKYPFRDSYMTPPIKPAEWRKIVRHCIASASAEAA